MLPFPDRRPKSILVIIDAVSFQLFVAESQRSLAGRSQINWRIVFVGDDFVENAADLQSGGILTGRNVLAFDGLVDSFQSANMICHLARKFFQHVL